MNFFVSSLAQDPFYFFSWVCIVTFSICFHEYAHASVALQRGDDSAARQGHLSLNPMVQMGPTSIVMLLLLGIAWGSVPVNPGRLRTRANAAIVSLAGPAANFLLCLIFGAVTAGLVQFGGGGAAGLVTRFFSFGCVANAVLFVFNMLPVPMFDGWSVFSLFFSPMRDLSPQQAKISLIVLAILFISPLGRLVWWSGSWLSGQVLGAWIRLFGLFM